MGVNGADLLAWSDPLDWDNRRLLEVARMMALHATAYALTTEVAHERPSYGRPGDPKWRSHVVNSRPPVLVKRTI